MEFGPLFFIQEDISGPLESGMLELELGSLFRPHQIIDICKVTHET